MSDEINKPTDELTPPDVPINDKPAGDIVNHDDDENDALGKRMNELNARERDVSLKEYLAEKKLPAELFKDLEGFDLEQSKKILALLSKHSKALSVQIAEERFKQNGFEPAPKSTESMKSYGEMSIKERIALKQSNPELYEQLLSSYRTKIGG